MLELLIITALLVSSLWLAAWGEYRNHNPRDASLLGALGAGGALTASAAWLV
ncbi:hypothetical protein [Craterilacuibacter sp.]|uniref:hypothetical protein n=1 Tax=Craterilacuibacter sp. TaxID=2870909 RepID=UPI003F38ABCC